MKLSVIFILNALFALLGGIGLLVAPVQIMTPYGVSLGEGGIFISQITGGTVLGLSLISFMARKIKDAYSLKLILLSFGLIHLISAGIGLQALLTNRLNSTLWMDIILHGAFGLTFLYFWRSKKLSP